MQGSIINEHVAGNTLGEIYVLERREAKRVSFPTRNLYPPSPPSPSPRFTHCTPTSLPTPPLPHLPTHLHHPRHTTLAPNLPSHPLFVHLRTAPRHPAPPRSPQHLRLSLASPPFFTLSIPPRWHPLFPLKRTHKQTKKKQHKWPAKRAHVHNHMCTTTCAQHVRVSSDAASVATAATAALNQRTTPWENIPEA